MSSYTYSNAGSQMETYHYEPETPLSSGDGKLRTAAYCRVSTLMEEQELSFETQCNYYSELISKDPKMVLVGIYGDQGFSGLQSKKRKEFQRLIADCEAGKIDFILVKSLSRFSRNTIECMDYLQKLRDLGIGVYFEKEGLNSMDPQSQMILSIYASIAQSESCSISENIRWNRQRQAEIGDPLRCSCYGYRIIRQKGGLGRKWVIHEEEAKRIRLMFQWAYQGYSFHEIEMMVNAYEEKQGSKDRWSKSRVQYAMRREAYRGDILTDKTITLDYLKKKVVRNKGQVDQFYIEQHHEPIVDPVIYDTVQEYIRDGYLNGRNRLIREAWFKEHPEIMDRRTTGEDKKE